MSDSLIKQTHTSAKLVVPQARFLLLVGFMVGISIMSIEMAASRLLTPYFGNSLYIWTNIIGVMMLALTIGYTWGGKIADQYASERVLYLIILIAGVYIACIPWLAKFTIALMLHLVTEQMLSMFYVSFLSILPLFIVPFMCLGMVSPYIIKLSSHQIASIGNSTGKVAAYSTLGSIIGTFIPTFLTIPLLGTQKTILIFAFLLITIALLGLIKAYLSRQTTT